MSLMTNSRYEKRNSTEGKKLKNFLFIKVGCSSCCLGLDVQLNKAVEWLKLLMKVH